MHMDGCFSVIRQAVHCRHCVVNSQHSGGQVGRQRQAHTICRGVVVVVYIPSAAPLLQVNQNAAAKQPSAVASDPHSLLLVPPPNTPRPNPAGGRLLSSVGLGTSSVVDGTATLCCCCWSG